MADSTTYLWHAPELLPSDTSLFKSCDGQWYELPIINKGTSITATSIPDTVTLGKTTDDLYKLIETILNEGVGYHDSVVGFALPLFVALMAFSFGFLFDAVNHINEKYDSPTLSKIFEEHRLRKRFFKTTKVCVWIAGLYALLTLFLLGSRFWEVISLYVNIFVVLSSIVYALVTIGFAKFCMQFNKPSGVICLLEAKELRPFSSFKQRCKRLLAEAIHCRDEGWGIFQVYGKQLYAPWIEWQEQTDYLAGVIELSKHILMHRDSITFESVLKSVKKMSLRHNSSFEDDDSISVISTMPAHRIVNEFMIGIQKLLAQYPQSPDFYDNFCKWYLSSYDKSKIIGPYDMRQLQCILYAAVNNHDLMFLEKYIYRSASFFNYLNNLPLKSYILGESKETTENLRGNALLQLEQMRNIHFCIMAYASYCGLHELLQSLTKLNNQECLYPTNRKDVMARYASCLRVGNANSFVDERLIEDITGKRVNVEEMLGQYTSLMLILVTEKCTCKPLPKDDINFIEKSQPVLQKYANALKSNSRLTSIYPELLSVDFSIVLSDSISSVRLPETYEPKKKEDKLSVENASANRKLEFCCIIKSFLLSKCGIKEEKQAESLKRNNYSATCVSTKSCGRFI